MLEDNMLPLAGYKNRFAKPCTAMGQNTQKSRELNLKDTKDCEYKHKMNAFFFKKRATSVAFMLGCEKPVTEFRKGTGGLYSALWITNCLNSLLVFKITVWS